MLRRLVSQAAAAIRQIPALQAGERPFLIVLVALHKGALLPFSLYLDTLAESLCSNASALSSAPSSCDSNMRSKGDGRPLSVRRLRWVLQPLTPVSSVNQMGRIEELLMPRARYSFKPIAGNCTATTVKQAAAAPHATSLPPGKLVVRTPGAASSPGGKAQQDSVSFPDEHRQQHSGIQTEDCRDDGDHSWNLCPPSIKARRIHNLLSRRLMGRPLSFAMGHATCLSLAVLTCEAAGTATALILNNQAQHQHY